METYDRLDASLYDTYSTGLQGDVPFYVQEAVAAGSPVLELGCGTARILIPTAEAGVEITGLDRSPSMLAIARKKVGRLDPQVQRRISLVEGDMRDWALPQRFRLITIPYRAFLHLLTSEDQRRALRCIHHHLADGGRLVLNNFDPRLDYVVAHLGAHGPSLIRTSEFVHPETGRRVILWNAPQFDQERQTIDEYFIFEELDEEGRVVSKTYSSMVLRYLFRYEMQYLLELCGFRVEALYGDFGRGPFRYGGEQIWVAAKA